MSCARYGCRQLAEFPSVIRRPRLQPLRPRGLADLPEPSLAELPKPGLAGPVFPATPRATACSAVLRVRDESLATRKLDLALSIAEVTRRQGHLGRRHRRCGYLPLNLRLRLYLRLRLRHRLRLRLWIRLGLWICLGLGPSLDLGIGLCFRLGLRLRIKLRLRLRLAVGVPEATAMLADNASFVSGHGLAASHACIAAGVPRPSPTLMLSCTADFLHN
mmetsp:Transcript_69628/g.154105  ORF Transcript_69628/g.154105 Transcript_69628/m.154105 type:complete len:218 (+) Transcript_69628:172-825(+)